MSSPIITKVIEEMSSLPDELQQRVLTFVVALRQQHPAPDNTWDVLESLTRTIEAPSDWSTERDHYYLYGVPKHRERAFPLKQSAKNCWQN